MDLVEFELARFSWRDEAVMLLRIFMAGLAGGIIGFERHYSGKRAGTRTVAMVGFGAGIFTVVSIYGFEGGDPSRMAAQIASGVGFLGAGTILHRHGDVHGLTTAAAIWAAAALGAAAGAGMFILALGGSIMASLVLGLLPSDLGPDQNQRRDDGPNAEAEDPQREDGPAEEDGRRSSADGQ